MRSLSLTWLCLTSVVSAVPADIELGGKFMPKEDCVIKIGNREIPAKGVPLPYVVQQVSGNWLWIGDGWVQNDRVVPLDKAGDYYAEYLRSHSNSAWAHNMRGWVSYENGDYDDAIKHYSDAIRIDAQDALAYNNRGGARQKKGDYDNALQDYNQVVRLSPQETWGYNSLAWLLATCPKDDKRDGARAVSLATKACTLSGWKDAYLIDTLAAAYAEAGDFDKAAGWENKAISMLPGDKVFLAAAQDRLALYRDKRPFHEANGE